MEKICRIAREAGLHVIEDCAEAVGTTIDKRHVGTFGDIAAFSFYGNKTITTGEGGMVCTSDSPLFDRVTHLKGQGLAAFRQYWHDIIGYNYRMTNICAAIGLAQLEQVEDFLREKRRIAARYKEGLSGLPVALQEAPEHCGGSYWMVSILVAEPRTREDLRKHLESSGVETRPLFYPVHLMPMYSRRYLKLPIAEDISYRGINLPSYPALSDEDVESICATIQGFYAQR
jgi:perosamine synthetase